jgi:hypothetical protein
MNSSLSLLTATHFQILTQMRPRMTMATKTAAIITRNNKRKQVIISLS